VVAVVGTWHARLWAQDPERLDRGRFTAVFYPPERVLATSLLESAVRTDTFPGLPRPTDRVLLEVAPDKRRFREWVGPGAPEWGAAITFPEQRRVVMQGRSSGSDAGVPTEVFRHELAHLALHEFMGDLPPRWFDEGYASYAAREWTRDDALAANVGLALRGTPTFEELDGDFGAGTMTAQTAYALSYRAVVELASLDATSGLAPLLAKWKATGSLDAAMRGTFGLTLADFELRWRERTRRRYGALALVSDAAVGGLVILVVVFPLYVARRQRDRRRYAELVAADEAAERAARASVIDALLRGDDRPDVGAESPPPPPS
jgi:peptidase MA superfamily protein